MPLLLLLAHLLLSSARSLNCFFSSLTTIPKCCQHLLWLQGPATYISSTTPPPYSLERNVGPDSRT